MIGSFRAPESAPTTTWYSAPPNAAFGTPDDSARRQAWIAYAFASMIGLTLTIATYPPDFLLGLVDWPRAPEGDLAINVIAQRFFLADTWHWPPLQTLKLNAPYGVNIGFLDGIPLIALPLKLAAPWLPQGQHAVYLWYVVAWLLQPLAAVWSLRGAGERRLLPLVAVAVAAVSMPAWWHRFDHAALCSHFLLLLGLGLYLRLVRTTSWRLWLAAALLQLATLLTHPYLAVMVLAVIGAVPLTLMGRRDPRWPMAALGVAAVTFSLIGSMNLLGYLGANGGEGFGTYSMNLLAPVWPQHAALSPWALGAIDATGRGGWEGYNYLGAGLILGLVAVALSRARALAAMLRNHLGLLAALVGLTALALSQRPALGQLVLFDLGPMPEWLQNLRSSGRFFWPVAYALLLATMLLAARHPKRYVSAALLVAIGVLQFVDATELRHDVQHRVARYGANWLVDEQALRVLLTQHDNLTLLPSWLCVPAPDPRFDQELLRQLMVLASEIAVPVSTTYVARWQGPRRCKDAKMAAAPLGQGELRVLTPAAQAALLPLVPDHAKRCSSLGKLVVCRDPNSRVAPPATQTPTLTAGEATFFEGGAGERLLGEGWSDPEPEGTWSQAERAELRAERPPELAGPLKLEFEVQGFAASDDEHQWLEVSADGRQLGRWSLPDRRVATISTLLPEGPPGPLRLELRPDQPARPVDRGLSQDARLLGVQLRRLNVRLVGSWPLLSTASTRFGADAEGTLMLGQGWHQPEAGGTWTASKRAELQLDRPQTLTGALELHFRLEGLAPAGMAAQQVDLLLSGHHLARWNLPDRQSGWVTATLPPGPPGPMLLEFEVAAPTRPSDRGLNGDARWLGVNLQVLKVRPASWWQALVAQARALGWL